MTALYAFMRVTDDLADEPGDSAAKRGQLAAWRAGLADALRGIYSHRLHAALHHAVTAFGVNPCHLTAVIDGVESDLDPGPVETFDDLYPYCYRVASAVGLACLPVWGLRPGVPFADAEPAAEAAGIAFQLTNILRDLAEDHGRGRVYLPADELRRFGVTPATWHEPARRPAFRELMRLQVNRARDYYTRADQLPPLLSSDGRAIFGVMAGLYRRLLAEIERRDYDVFAGRVRVPAVTKARVFVAAWPARWGWA